MVYTNQGIQDKVLRFCRDLLGSSRSTVAIDPRIVHLVPRVSSLDAKGLIQTVTPKEMQEAL